MKGLITICLLAVSMSAVADRYRTPTNNAKAYGTGYGGSGYGTGYGGTGTGVAQQGQTLNSTNTLSGTQSLSGSQSQTGTVTGSQESSNNGVGVSVVGDDNDYKRPTPPVSLAPRMHTTQCIISVDTGGAVPSFALSIGGYFVDKECMIDRDISLFTFMEITGRAPQIDKEFYHRVMCEKERYQIAMAGRGEMECYPVKAPPVRVITSTYNTCHVADVDCIDGPEVSSRKKAKGWGGLFK